MRYERIDNSLFTSNRKNYIKKVDSGSASVFISNDVISPIVLLKTSCIFFVSQAILYNSARDIFAEAEKMEQLKIRDMKQPSRSAPPMLRRPRL